MKNLITASEPKYYFISVFKHYKAHRRYLQ